MRKGGDKIKSWEKSQLKTIKDSLYYALAGVSTFIMMLRCISEIKNSFIKCLKKF